MKDIRDPETYAIIGAAMEVHCELGRGFLEAPYGEALQFEFELRAMPFRREVAPPIVYKGRTLECSYRADFIVFDSIIVALEAIKALTDVERAQVINYLKATGYTRAVLINFGNESLEDERLVNHHRA